MYTGFDGNTTSSNIRTVSVVDTLDPQLISLIGYDPYYLEYDTQYVDDGIVLDQGSYVTSITNNISNTTNGNYTVTYNVSDGTNTNTFTRDVVLKQEMYPVYDGGTNSDYVRVSGISDDATVAVQITQSYFYVYKYTNNAWSLSVSLWDFSLDGSYTPNISESALSGDGNIVVLTKSSGFYILRYDRINDTLTVIETFTHNGYVFHLSVSYDGYSIITNDGNSGTGLYEYYSTDSGSTWNSTLISNTGEVCYNSSMSNNGNVFVAIDRANSLGADYSTCGRTLKIYRKTNGVWSSEFTYDTGITTLNRGILMTSMSRDGLCVLQSISYFRCL